MPGAQTHFIAPQCGARPLKTHLGLSFARRARVACSAAPQQALDRSAEAFEDLAQKAGVDLDGCELRPGEHMRGVFATRALGEGHAAMEVPLQACIDLDYNQGLRIRDADWPLLHSAVRSGAAEALPWEVLFGLALVDARRGYGDALWREYAAHLLPPPGSVPLPCLQTEAALGELQHPAFEAAALEQAGELRGMWERVVGAGVGAERPLLLEELQWGFACARSRAFALSADRFVQVPFMDCINHAQPANSQLSLEGDGTTLVVRAGKGVQGGTELTLSYTGKGAKTNRQLLASSGFVIPDSASDRLDLDLQEGFVGTAPLRGRPGAGLSLGKLQNFLGDAAFMKMMAGERSVTTSAIKSLPTYDEEIAPGDTAGVAAEERELVADLKARLDALEAEFVTSAAEDEELLAAAPREERGAWGHVAVQYRLERKRLAAAARGILEWYAEQM